MKTTHVRRPLAGLLAAAALLAPAAAEAATYYRVDANGSGTYALNVDLSGEDSIETSTVDASFQWQSFIAAVAFDDNGRLIGPVETPDQPTKLSGTLKRNIRVISKENPDRAIVTDCEGEDAADQWMGGTAMHGVDGHPNAIVFEPFDTVDFFDHHCTDGSEYAFGIFDDGHDPHGIWDPPGDFDEFDQVFELPAEAVGQGKIIQFVKPQSDQLIPSECPGYAQVPGERCSSNLSWAGSITFTKIAEDPLEPAPLTPPDVVPPRVDGPVAPPADSGDDLIAPLVPAKAKLNAGARTLSFTAGCPAGCAGTAKLTRGRKSLATLKFKLAAGEPRTVRLKLPAKARRALRGSRRAKLSVVLRPAAGPPARAQVFLK